MAKKKIDATEKEAVKAAKAAEKEAVNNDVANESHKEITLDSIKEKTAELSDILTNYINQQQKKGKSIDRFAYAKQQIQRLQINNLIA